MKIQCDVCERAEATVICCADEAALCAKCDVEVHEANRLASKHQRLLLQNLSNKLPRCDICQEKAAFIFCVEDRALFCRECDEPIHSNCSLSGNHQRLLVTGIQVALTSIIARNSTDIAGYSDPPNRTSQPLAKNLPPTSQPSTTYTSSPWVVDDLLQFSDFEANEKKETMGFGELDWFSDIGLFGDQVPQAAAEVPQLRVAQHPCNSASYRPPLKSSVPLKRARIEISDDEDFFTVPDLG